MNPSDRSDFDYCVWGRFEQKEEAENRNKHFIIGFKLFFVFFRTLLENELLVD